ncbi:Inositol polyphosphate 5-phosphatase, putative [Hondaea fermentalgiana]|uniref:Inositol polyphosphate 5-phosphatase, putative n=1 Tax=Hondaea fermentalgiana TaxID=2315210 RepID=A0A2R5GZG0_9STRA|nr:Inositol polyphosphate 5-phosphatase, putative [Hondaea fermentalgiana]|eukprot:GBG34153.1 Inositol polyphosphate 5-phosphatase, putative [Hondaea fermentalgiana]
MRRLGGGSGRGARGGAVDGGAAVRHGVDPLDPMATASFEDVAGEATAARELEKRQNSIVVTQKIRDEWIRDQLRSRKDEFTKYHDLKLFVTTWNVNGKKPSESLEALLSVGGAERPDIYVCGFQELVDLTAGNVVMDSASKDRTSTWVDAIGATLKRMYGGEGLHYKLLTARNLVGVMVCVFVNRAHVARVPQLSVQTAITATGVMGMGNKGGVSLRFQLYDTTFCFVCAHLAAHREAVEARNADYRNIMLKTTFKDDAQTLVHRSAEERLAAPSDATTMLPDGHGVYNRANDGALGPASVRGGGLAPATMPGFGAVGPDDTDSEAGETSAGMGAGDGGSGNTAGAGGEDDMLQHSSLNLAPVLAEQTFSIADHDYVFWLGDFNYRIVMPHSIDEVFRHVDANDLAWLRRNDQLLSEQAAGRTFVGFKEGEIEFLPTYKFQAGTNQYDRRPEKKVRAPAFCDRILWRDVNGASARIQQYVSCPTLTISDHKPVIGIFEARVKEVVPSDRSRVFQEIVRQLDRWENAERPQLQVEPQTITFEGGLRYMERREETILLANTCNVPVTWRFVPNMEDLAICKPWLRLDPDFGLIPPGERAEVRVIALVEHTTARAVAAGADDLDDILVLRLEGGRDHFVCVSSAFAPTCFGVDLARLARTHHPFAASADDIKVCRLDREARLGADKAAQPLRLPKELWWLCNFLWNFDLLKVSQIFVMSARLANPDKLRAVRRAIDAGHELVPEDEDGASVTASHAMAHAVATIIIEFLQALPEPVVPFALFPRFDMENQSMDVWGRRFLDQLPPLNHNVFIYIITFLREIVKCRPYNDIKPSDLAAVFAHVLLRPAEVLVKQKETSVQANVPFDLPNWFTGEKKESTLQHMAETLILHFINADRAFLL